MITEAELPSHWGLEGRGIEVKNTFIPTRSVEISLGTGPSQLHV